MSLTHCTTEREAKCSKLGHICLHTKVPTLLYDVALGALSFHVAIWGDVAKIQLAKAHNRGLGIHWKSITRTGRSICNQLHWKSKIQNPKNRRSCLKGSRWCDTIASKQNHRRVHRPRKSHVEISNAMSQNKTIDINPRPKITRRSSEYQVLKQNHRHIPETKIHT